MASRILITFALAIAAALVLAGCEINTSVALRAGPSFSLSGSGRLVSFTVWGPRPGSNIATPLDSKHVMWCIQPSDPPSGNFVAYMDIVYGGVPTGYVQKLPVRGPALALTAGRVYAFGAEATGASGVDGFFYMAPSGPTMIHVPDLCESSFVGDVRPVRCGTGQPYVEPTDLEKFAQQNRAE